MSPIRLAIQKRGRLSTESVRLLEKIGTGPELGSRSLVAMCRDFDMNILSVRDDDIPEYVATGAADLGIVGENIIAEKGADLEILSRLGFGRSRLMILAPFEMELSDPRALSGKRVATSYPRSLRRYLARFGVECAIIDLSGTVEIAPRLGIADAVCDLVSTGNTARLNGLEPKLEISASEAVFCAARGWRDRIGSKRAELIDELRLRIEATLSAGSMRYLMLNAPKEQMEKLLAIFPGASSPSILELRDPRLVAIHVVMTEQDVWNVLPRAKALGGRDFVSGVVDAFVR